MTGIKIFELAGLAEEDKLKVFQRFNEILWNKHQAKILQNYEINSNLSLKDQSYPYRFILDDAFLQNTSAKRLHLGITAVGLLFFLLTDRIYCYVAFIIALAD